MLTTSHDHAHHHLRVGDRVTVHRDVLAELGRVSAAMPPTWFCVPAGTPARLIGWRDSRAVIDLDGTPQRIVVFVGEIHLARALRDPATLVARVSIRPARPTRPATRRTSYRSRHRS